MYLKLSCGPMYLKLCVRNNCIPLQNVEQKPLDIVRYSPSAPTENSLLKTSREFLNYIDKDPIEIIYFQTSGQCQNQFNIQENYSTTLTNQKCILSNFFYISYRTSSYQRNYKHSKMPIISFSLILRQKANVLAFNLNQIFVIEFLLHEL